MKLNCISTYWLRKCTFIFALILLYNSCNQRIKEDLNSGNSVIIDSSLIKIYSDTLHINWLPKRKMYSSTYYDDKDGICKFSNDTLSILLSEGCMPSNRLEVIIINGKFYTNHWEHNCTYGHNYKMIKQNLTLNKSNFKVGDTLVGELYFQSIYIWDTIKNVVDTTIISGKFKLKIRNKNYIDDSLFAENSYKELLITLSNSAPDTVTQLRIGMCGLKNLPNELIKFKNLELLEVWGNDFSNSDLSMLCQFKKLKTISLQDCNISQFPSSIFCLKNLEELDLFNNDITYLPLELFQLNNIKELQLSGNLLTSIPIEILNLKKLEMLEISGYKNRNRIKKLPSNFFKILQNLKEFYPPDCMLPVEYKDYKPISVL